MNENPATPYLAMIRQFEADPPGKLYCVHGDSRVFHLSLHAASLALLAGTRVALVDGSNRFDPYYITEFARRMSSEQNSKCCVRPEQLLESIFISRAFTCYQTEAVITDRLPEFVRQHNIPVVIIFGLLDTFYDEQAPLFEVNASLVRIIGALQQLKQERVSILLASLDRKLESKERNALFPKLMVGMDRVLGLMEGDGRVRVPPCQR